MVLKIPLAYKDSFFFKSSRVSIWDLNIILFPSSLPKRLLSSNFYFFLFSIYIVNVNIHSKFIKKEIGRLRPASLSIKDLEAPSDKPETNLKFNLPSCLSIIN